MPIARRYEISPPLKHQASNADYTISAGENLLNFAGWVRDVSKDMFTGIDGVSTDIGRVGGFIGLMVILGIGIREEWMANPDYPFDFVAFCGGLGVYLGAWGALLKIKETTEPKP